MTKKKEQAKVKEWELSIKLKGARTQAQSIILSPDELTTIGDSLEEPMVCDVADRIRGLLAHTGAIQKREYTVSFTCRVMAHSDNEATEIGDKIALVGSRIADVTDFYVECVDEW